MGIIRHGEDAGGSGTGYIGIFTNYTDLITQFPVGPNLLALAYVKDSQGTFWLPGSMGGDFFSKGTYLWDGVDWVDGLDEVAKELQDILDVINTQDLFDVLTEGNSVGGLNIKMGLASILFGATDLVSMTEDGAGGWMLLNNSGAFSGISFRVQDGTTLGNMSLGFTKLLLEQTGLLDSGKIHLEFAITDPKLTLESDQASGGKMQMIQSDGSPTADRLHKLQDKDGVLAHILDKGIEGFFLTPQGSFGTGGGWADSGFIGNLPVLFYAQNSTERGVFMFYATKRIFFDAIDPEVGFTIYSVDAPSGGDEDVEWELQARYRADGDPVVGAPDETLTQTQTLATQVADSRQSNLEFTLDRTKISDQDVIFLILRRLGGDANDNYSSDVGVGQSGITAQTTKHNP